MFATAAAQRDAKYAGQYIGPARDDMAQLVRSIFYLVFFGSLFLILIWYALFRAGG